MRVVATAGHVDHGKSSLVLALTGTDPDRFPEEKARGLTIDLGFAFTRLPSGTEVGFVDVPGHVRFIKNMLAGVGAVETALLVVAATEGWMPQSEEHLQILELLGVRHGMVALTKADLVDGETLELAQLGVADHLAGTALADVPVVVCDSRSGRGLEDARAGLDAVLAATPPPPDRGRARLWVDRVFAAKGAGTIVTGTLSGGRVAVDDEVLVVPGDRRARVRAVESHHARLDVAEPGSRVALNLAGVEHHELTRGHAIVRAGQWRVSSTVDVALAPLAGEKLRRRGRLQAYIGSGEHGVQIRALDPDARFARLGLDTGLPLAPGDRLVLRDPGSRRTVGGAEILDVAPLGRARDAPARLARPLGPRLLAARPWIARRELGPLTGLDTATTARLVHDLVAGGHALEVHDWIVAADELARVRAETLEQVLAHHREHPLATGPELGSLATAIALDADRLRAALDGAADLSVERGTVRHVTHRGRPSELPEAEALVAALAGAPFAPPTPEEIGADRALVRALVREGALVDLDGIVFTADSLARARELVAHRLREQGTLTVADARDLLGSTRKYVLPILNRLDAEGVTRRRGDERVAGPRADRAP